MKLGRLAWPRWLRVRPVETAPAIDRALALESRRGLELAIRARLAAFVAIGLWLVLAIPSRFTLFHHAFIALFIVLGLVQLGLLRSRHARSWHAYLFAGLDGVLLALVLLMPNPLLEVQPPPALALNYANIIFYFVVLAGAALTLSPMLVLWTALSAMLCWGLGVALIVALPEVVTEREPPFATATSMDETIRAFLAPNFVHTNIQIKKAFVVLLVAAILAVVVERARRIVYRQAAAERERTNLARYFSPNLVPALAARGQLFDEVRRQPIAILFTDIKGFTTLCERLPPEPVVELLRALHQRLSGCVFEHDGTLDKFTGDGLMATFGTPDPRDDDATRALACARAMLDVVDRLNAERAAAGKFTIELGIGVHYGLVVQGDISGGPRLDFTVLGDAVNVAARLERATRDLNARLIVSQAVIDRLHLEQAAPDLTGLEPQGPLPVRGRQGLLEVWALSVPLSNAPEMSAGRHLGPASA